LTILKVNIFLKVRGGGTLGTLQGRLILAYFVEVVARENKVLPTPASTGKVKAVIF
jgi:hypothetical protein